MVHYNRFFNSWIERVPPMLADWFQVPVGSCRSTLAKRCLRPVQACVNGWIQGVLPLACHRFNIHCKSSNLANEAQ